MPTIGVLVVGAPSSEKFWRIFREVLREQGYVEGQTVRFEFRSDHGQADRLPELAAELVRLKVDVIVPWVTPAARAPGGNITGTGGLAPELAAKCVELIREILPFARRVVALVNAADLFSSRSSTRSESGAKRLDGQDRGNSPAD